VTVLLEYLNLTLGTHSWVSLYNSQRFFCATARSFYDDYTNNRKIFHFSKWLACYVCKLIVREPSLIMKCCIRTRTRTRIHTPMHPRMHACTHIHTRMHTHTNTHTEKPNKGTLSSMWPQSDSHRESRCGHGKVKQSTKSNYKNKMIAIYLIGTPLLTVPSLKYFVRSKNTVKGSSI